MSIPTTVFHETTNPYRTYECPICLDSLVENEYINFAECGHKYHLKCIQDWKNKACPDLIYCFKCPTCDEIRNVDIESSYIKFDFPKPTSPDNLLKKIRRCVRNIGCR